MGTADQGVMNRTGMDCATRQPGGESESGAIGLAMHDRFLSQVRNSRVR